MFHARLLSAVEDWGGLGPFGGSAAGSMMRRDSMGSIRSSRVAESGVLDDYPPEVGHCSMQCTSPGLSAHGSCRPHPVPCQLMTVQQGMSSVTQPWSSSPSALCPHVLVRPWMLQDWVLEGQQHKRQAPAAVQQYKGHAESASSLSANPCDGSCKVYASPPA